MLYRINERNFSKVRSRVRKRANFLHYLANELSVCYTSDKKSIVHTLLLKEGFLWVYIYIYIYKTKGLDLLGA